MPSRDSGNIVQRVPFNSFSALWDFFQKIFLNSPPFPARTSRISEVKRYIRTFDVISELYRFIKKEAEVRKPDFFMKTSYAYFKNFAFWALVRYSSDFQESKKSQRKIQKNPVLSSPVLTFLRQISNKFWTFRKIKTITKVMNKPDNYPVPCYEK